MLLENFWRNLRFALRSLRKQPGFTITVVLTLALGIGANTAVFSVVDAMLLRPLPVPNPGAIIAIDTPASRLMRFGNSSYLDYRDVVDRSKSFQSLALFQSLTAGMNPDPGNSDSRAAAVHGLLVSGNFFSCFEVTPALGRWFLPEEGSVPGKYPVAIISYALWQRAFRGNSDVIGRQIRLNGHSFTVVGVAPKSFPGPDIFARSDIYVPLMVAGDVSAGGEGLLTQRSWRGFRIRGRLRPGVTIARAQAELNAIMSELEREHPDTNKDNVMILRREIDRRFAQSPTIPVLLMILVVLIILITCANIANLMMAKATSRLREISTQLAIGATRTRLLAQFLLESAILALAGGAAGVGLGWGGVKGIAALIPPSERGDSLDLRLDHRVLGYALLVSAAAVLLYGLAPAFVAIREGWRAVVNTRTAVSGSRMVGAFARRALISGQVALCTVLLVVGALFLKAFERAQSSDLGFNPSNLLLVTLDPSLAGYSDERTVKFYNEVSEEAANIPGVKASSLAALVPLRGGQAWDLTVAGYTAPGGEKWLEILTNRVGKQYFATMQIPLLSGREFTERDTPKSPQVAIVNEAFARKYIVAGDGDLAKTLGHTIQLRDTGPIQIAGVVRDSVYGEIAHPAEPIFYLPISQHPASQLTLHLRI